MYLYCLLTTTADIPTCEELLSRMERETEAIIRDTNELVQVTAKL
jgi:hypothetical protein